MNKGIRAAIIDGLLAMDWHFVQCKSRKYVALQFATDDRLVYVGKSGGVRTGRTVSSSISLTGTRWATAVAEIGRQSESFSSCEQAQAMLVSMVSKGANNA